MFIPVALLNSFFILVASVIAAAVLAWLFSLPIAPMIIATSPGGLAEMTITAQALQISVPLVVPFHLFRAVIVNMGPSISTPGPHGCSIAIIGKLQANTRNEPTEMIIEGGMWLLSLVAYCSRARWSRTLPSLES